MHECPNCGGYCYCDQEDTLVDVVVIQCSHICPDDDTYDPDWNDCTDEG